MSIWKIVLGICILGVVIVCYAEKRGVDRLIEDLKIGYND